MSVVHSCPDCSTNVAIPLGRFTVPCSGCPATLYCAKIWIKRAVTCEDVQKEVQMIKDRIEFLKAASNRLTSSEHYHVSSPLYSFYDKRYREVAVEKLRLDDSLAFLLSLEFKPKNDELSETEILKAKLQKMEESYQLEKLSTESSISVIRRLCNETKAEKVEAEKKAAELEKVVESVRFEKQQLQNEKTALFKRNQVLLKEKQDLREENRCRCPISDQDPAVSALKKDIADQKSFITGLKAKNFFHEKSQEDNIKSILNTRFEELPADETKMLKDELAEAQDQLRRLLEVTPNSNLFQENEELRGKNKELEMTVGDQEDMINILQQDISALELEKKNQESFYCEEIEQIAAENERLKGDNKDLAAETALLGNVRESLVKEIDFFEKTNRSEMNELHSQIAVLVKDKKEAEKRIFELEAKEYEDGKWDTVKDAEKMEKTDASLNEELRGEIKKLQMTVLEQKNSLEILQAGEVRLRQEISALEIKLKNRESFYCEECEANQEQVRPESKELAKEKALLKDIEESLLKKFSCSAGVVKTIGPQKEIVVLIKEFVEGKKRIRELKAKEYKAGKWDMVEDAEKMKKEEEKKKTDPSDLYFSIFKRF